MLKRTVKAIEAHAIEQYPRECCGLVVMVGRSERYIPCTNKAPEDSRGDVFVLDDREFAEAEKLGRVCAIVHSHPDYPATASESDKTGCEETDLPWIIVSVRKGDDGTVYTDGVVRIQPEGYRAPLVGREFHHGVLDCYSIVRDWFRWERGVELMNFHRDDGWWKGDKELYLDNLAVAGFVVVPPGQPLQVGDMILMQYQSDRVNHAGVYIDDQVPAGANVARMKGLMLHHLYGKPSQVVVYGGFWQQITHTVARHKSQIME